MGTQIFVKGLKQDYGLGDAVKSFTDYFHLNASPNCKCEQRRQALNKVLTFTGQQPPQQGK